MGKPHEERSAAPAHILQALAVCEKQRLIPEALAAQPRPEV